MTPPQPAPDDPAGPLRRAVDWTFRDRTTGRITIAQFPNPPLWVALAAMVVRRVAHPEGTAGTVVGGVVAGALVWWSVDELVRGVNPWRRALGAGVLALTLRGLAAA